MTLSLGNHLNQNRADFSPADMDGYKPATNWQEASPEPSDILSAWARHPTILESNEDAFESGLTTEISSMGPSSPMSPVRSGMGKKESV